MLENFPLEYTAKIERILDNTKGLWTPQNTIVAKTLRWHKDETGNKTKRGETVSGWGHTARQCPGKKAGCQNLGEKILWNWLKLERGSWCELRDGWGFLNEYEARGGEIWPQSAAQTELETFAALIPKLPEPNYGGWQIALPFFFFLVPLFRWWDSLY